MNDWSQGENAIALSTASFTIASITSSMIRLFRLFDFFYRHLATGDVHDFISQFQFLDLDNYQAGGLGTPYPDIAGVFAFVSEQDHMGGVLRLHA